MRVRRGTTLMELSVALGLLAAIMALAVQMLGWMAAERRSQRCRQVAQQEAANCLERLHGEPFDQLSSALVPSLSTSAQQQLPGGELSLEVADDPLEPTAKRIAVQVRWRNRAGEFDAPVRLTTWRWEAP